MFKLEFSKSFLYWMKNDLCDGFQYVQVDDKKSLLEHLHFGVPPGVNFRPVVV